jgi:hypothetical protein
MWKKILVVIIIIVLLLSVVAALKKRRRRSEFMEIERISKLVKKFYGACESSEAAIIMAELAIMDQGKKGHVDAEAELRIILKKVKSKPLRNFTRFLIADYYKEKGQFDKMKAVLQEIVDENVAEAERIRGAKPEPEKETSSKEPAPEKPAAEKPAAKEPTAGTR